MKKADTLRALALLTLIAAAVAGLIVLSVNAPLREALGESLGRFRGSVWGREEPWMWRRPQGKTDEDLPVLDPQPAEMDALRRRLRDPVTRLASALAAPLPTVRQIVTRAQSLQDIRWLKRRRGACRSARDRHVIDAHQ